MSDQYIPPIGTSGLFTLLTPFDVKITADIPYTLIAVRKLSDILAAGGNPLKTYYQDNSLTTDIYNTDISNGVCVLSLQSSSGSVLYVPASYVKSYPDIGGIPYSVLALAISLGPIPDSLDLTYLKSQIVEVVRDTVGIDSEINTVAISSPSLLTYDDSKAIEAARKAKIAIVKTDRALYLEASTLLASARQRIQELEKYIKSTKT